MICDFCNGEGSMYRVEEDGDLYTWDEIFPLQTVEITCPVCEGKGEIFLGDDDDLELQDS